VLAAYIAGPIAAATWSKGRRRVVWAVAGIASLVTGVALAVDASAIGMWLWKWPNGVLYWLIGVPIVILTIATAWTRAIGEASHGRAKQYPHWLRRPWAVLTLGMLVPGLGLRVAGHPQRAVWAFWIVGPMAAAWVVLANWRSLWEESRGAVHPGISGASLEIAFVIAAGVAATVMLIWMVQALDGARRVSPARSVGASNLMSVALLLSLLLGVGMFRPIAFARGLHQASIVLQLDGFRVIPLGLCEAAARLDPAEPIYLAHAAELNEALGMEDAAQAKRQIIEQRLNTYLQIARRAERPSVRSSMVDRPLDVEDHLPAANRGTW
jgi:hypothetical protein